VALNFQALSRSEIPARDLAASIMRALEFDRARGRNPFRELTDVAHDLVIASDVRFRLRRVRRRRSVGPKTLLTMTTVKKNAVPTIEGNDSSTTARTLPSCRA